MPEIKQSYYLQQALNFTDADLKANRAGQLSENQIKNLRKSELFRLLLTGIALFIIGIVFLFYAQNTAQRLLIMIVVSPALIFLVLTFNRLLYDLRKGELLSITRNINLDTTLNTAKANKLHITDDLKLRMSEDISRLIKIGQTYTFYYLPETKMLVSLENADTDTLVRELKDELKYLDAQHASLKAKRK